MKLTIELDMLLKDIIIHYPNFSPLYYVSPLRLLLVWFWCAQPEIKCGFTFLSPSLPSKSLHKMFSENTFIIPEAIHNCTCNAMFKYQNEIVGYLETAKNEVNGEFTRFM